MPLSPLTSLAGGLKSLTNLGAAGGSSQPSGSTSTAAAPGPSSLSGELAQIVTIVLGLILIIAGLFSFKSVRETGATIVKAAAVA